MSEQTSAATGKADAYPCPKCGGSSTMKPGTESLVCEHCGHSERIVPAGQVHERDFFGALATARRAPASEFTSGAREVMCKNCGARTVTTAQSTRCPFCDTALVVEVKQTEAVLVPESVLPFHVEKSAAAEHFKVWLRGRWFAPFDLVKRAKQDGLDGVYLPYWTYDSDTRTDYRGERGEYYYETEEYTDSNGKRQTREVRKTRWYNASGTVDVSFNDVLVCASQSLPEDLVDKLEPWDLPSLRPFDGKFLAGFTTERYAVELRDGFQRAEQKMEPRIDSEIKRDIGGDEQRIDSKSIHHDRVTFKHVLLPLWISSFRYGERVYRVTVNARTGEVAGERPWSVFKIAMFVLFWIAVIAGIIVLVKSR